MFLRDEVHEPHADENQEAGEDLEGGQMVQAHRQRDDHRNDGLDIGVHAHHHRAQPLLADGDEEIGHEGGEDDHIEDLPEHVHGHGREVRRPESADTEREGHQGREQEHPLHEGHHRILPDDGLEDAYVGGETQGVHEHPEDAPDGRGIGPGTDRDAVVDEDQDAHEAERDARHAAPGDLFLDDDGRDDQRHDRAQRAHDGRVDGRRLRDGEQEGQLRHEESEEGRDDHLPDIFLMDVLVRRREQGPQPEQGRRPEGAEAEERHRRDVPVQGDALAADDVEPENGVRREARQVADE